ncbi:MAG TPA: hypothetical protein VF884_14200 [Nitrososphaeraceae archaeon]
MIIIIPHGDVLSATHYQAGIVMNVKPIFVKNTFMMKTTKKDAIYKLLIIQALWGNDPPLGKYYFSGRSSCVVK